MHDRHEELVQNDVLQYNALLALCPWLIANEQNAILSPDVDGILCGLLMSHYFNWNIVGFYDGKNLALKNDVSVSDCVFLDMDIYRNNIKSCGHHMVAYNRNDLPANWDHYHNCINPNIIRRFDALHDFQPKYPFATIHFLLCVIGHHIKLTLPKEAIPALLYVDGTFKNLLNYPENCTSWLRFLDAKDKDNLVYPLFILFANRKLAETAHNMEDMFRGFKEIAGGKKRGGDKIKIKDIRDNTFPQQYLEQIENLVRFLAQNTGWAYVSERWAWTHLNLLNFSKEIEGHLTGNVYSRLMQRNPASLAITAAKRMEYTLDENDILA